MLLIGRTIGSYRITKLLGEGGMGVVYQATDNIEREVALKALRPFSHDASQTDRLRADRLRAEAMALGRLHHPNIASLFHLLEEDGAFYLVMELVQGQTLEELLAQQGALPPRLALELLIDALHGFEHAHARGVIHRDIKASNLMVSSDGATKIMDFGIAHRSGAARLTQTGQPVGTLPYMSPEQVRGLEPDARSDIYALGVLLFELLTGRVPFSAASDYELMREHLEKVPPPARFLVPSLPPELDEVLAKALAKAPTDRFQSAAELRETLETLETFVAAWPHDTATPIHTTTPVLRASPVQDRPTADSLNGGRYVTQPIEDRYATRVQGTPLPTPVAPPPVAPAAGVSAAGVSAAGVSAAGVSAAGVSAVAAIVNPAVTVNPAPQQSMSSQRWIWAVGGAILVAVLLTATVLRPTAPVQPGAVRAPLAPAVGRKPLSRVAVPKLAARRSHRAIFHTLRVAPQNKSRVRVAAPLEKSRRRIPRVASHRPIAARVEAKREVRREARRPMERGAGAEQATLRALIKGH